MAHSHVKDCGRVSSLVVNGPKTRGGVRMCCLANQAWARRGETYLERAEYDDGILISRLTLDGTGVSQSYSINTAIVLQNRFSSTQDIVEDGQGSSSGC